jgi:hypothetical protein
MARDPQRDKNGSSAGNVLPFGRTTTKEIHSIQWQVCAEALLLLRLPETRKVTIGRKARALLGRTRVAEGYCVHAERPSSHRIEGGLDRVRM